MDWTKNYEQLMRGLGVEPYSCFVTGCNHAARSTFGQLVHREFGSHHMGHRRPADDCRPIKSKYQRTGRGGRHGCRQQAPPADTDS